MTLYIKVKPERLADLKALLDWFGDVRPKVCTQTEPYGYIYLEYKPTQQLFSEQINAISAIAPDLVIT